MRILFRYFFIIFIFSFFITNTYSNELDESDRNIDKITRLIINDPAFFKKTKYHKKITSRGIDPKTGEKIKSSILAVYMNYEDVLKKITLNPELDTIGEFAWGLEFSKKQQKNLNKNFTGEKALSKCRKHAAKKNLNGGECIFVQLLHTIGHGSSVGEENYLKRERLKRKILLSGQIDESDEMLNKIYKIIMNHKEVRKKYLKYSDIGRYNQKKIKSMALAVALNYEKEIINLMVHPQLINFEPISVGWVFNTHHTYGISNSVLAIGKQALDKCNKNLRRKKDIEDRNIQCQIIDYRELDQHLGNLLFAENYLSTIRKDTMQITQKKAEEEQKKQEILAKKKAEEEQKKQELLAKKKAEEEQKKQELLAKKKAEEEQKKQELLAKKKAEEEQKKQELLAKKKAEEEQKKQELLAKKKAEEEKKKELLAQKKADEEKIKFEKKKKEIAVDNNAPEIVVTENMIVSSQVYVLKGTVKDKSEFIFEIDGQPLDLDSNGNFIFEGFVLDEAIGEELNLVAVDRWNNVSEKIVKIKVKSEETKVVKSYERLMPSKVKAKQDDNKVALIIGVEKYENLNNLDAIYANRDAKAFKAYANRALGIPNENIKLLVDTDASLLDTIKALKIWLPQKTKGSKKDIFIFFAGHGLASDNGKDLYILPQDGDSILLEDTAISRVEIFKQIQKLNPNSVTMFFDTCYSGQTRKEETLVAGLRPVRLVAEEQDIPNNFTIFSASNMTQTSGSIEQAKHGIFSYYLMKGLEGNADQNLDNKITNGELIAYLKQNVSEEAFINNRQQDPMLTGDPNRVLIKLR